MTVQEGLLSFIGDIYEASWQPDRWEAVLAHLCQRLNAKSGGIHVQDHLAGQRYLLASHGLPALAGTTCRLGPAPIRSDLQIQNTRPIAEAALVTTHESQENQNPLYYRLMMKPNNNRGYIAAVNLFNDDEWHAGIGLHRAFDGEPFNDTELRLLDVLAPHFQRAMRIQKTLQQTRSREASLRSTLSGLAPGVAVLNSHNRVIYRNAACEYVLARHPALQLHGDKLRTYYQKDAAQLWAMLSTLRQGDTKQQAMGLHHPEGKQPLVILATRLGQQPAETLPELHDDGQIALYISDPDTHFCDSEDDIMAVFSLTRAEAKVAIALVNGLSLQHIAIQNDVSRETVRTQLKGVFTKLGVSKQQDVVRLLMNSGLRAKPSLLS